MGAQPGLFQSTQQVPLYVLLMYYMVVFENFNMVEKLKETTCKKLFLFV